MSFLDALGLECLKSCLGSSTMILLLYVLFYLTFQAKMYDIRKSQIGRASLEKETLKYVKWTLALFINEWTVVIMVVQPELK